MYLVKVCSKFPESWQLHFVRPRAQRTVLWVAEIEILFHACLATYFLLLNSKVSLFE